MVMAHSASSRWDMMEECTGSNRGLGSRKGPKRLALNAQKRQLMSSHDELSTTAGIEAPMGNHRLVMKLLRRHERAWMGPLSCPVSRHLMPVSSLYA